MVEWGMRGRGYEVMCREIIKEKRNNVQGDLIMNRAILFEGGDYH
jgi:hypothetical protein